MPAKIFGIIVLLCSCIGTSFSQGGLGQSYPDEYPVTTTVPFLLINTEPRSSAFGEITVVSNSPNQPSHLLLNPSLLAGRQHSLGIRWGLTPWFKKFLRQDITDMRLIDLDAYVSINNKNSISFTYRHFKLGNIRFTNVTGESTGEYYPEEYVIQMRYARLLSKKFSLGIGMKYIFSDLASGQTVAGVDITPGRSYAGDIGFDYRDAFKMKDVGQYKLNVGLAIQNLGAKISYTEDAEADFIPTILNLGVLNSFEFNFGALDSGVVFRIDVGYQVDKLMVPTPSDEDADSNTVMDYREKPLMKGVFGSFADAPGGAGEEFRELTHHIAWSGQVVIQKKYFVGFALGAFFENENKGNRRYIQFGPSVGVYGFFFDFAYLEPLESRSNPLDKTWKIAFGYQLKFKNRPLVGFL